MFYAVLGNNVNKIHNEITYINVTALLLLLFCLFHSCIIIIVLKNEKLINTNLLCFHPKMPKGLYNHKNILFKKIVSFSTYYKILYVIPNTGIYIY